MKKRNLFFNVFDLKHFAAFTLAEVLITLGVIGVVAALTIPGLIADYQKKQTVEQLKVAKSTLEQGFRLMLATEGVDSLADTEFVKSFKGTAYEGGGLETPEATPILKKYFPGIDIVETSDRLSQLKEYYSDSNYFGANWKLPDWFFPNGFAVNIIVKKTPYTGPIDCDTIKAKGGAYCSLMVGGWNYLYIDVNGIKGPNRHGADVFYFVLTENGMLYPTHDSNWSIFNTGEPATAWYIYSNPDRLCPDGAVASAHGSNYAACAARIIHDGWQIKYNWKGAKKVL